MSTVPPPPANQWEELNRPRSERTPPPPPPPVPGHGSSEQPSSDGSDRPGIDPFVLLGIGAFAFVVLAGGFMILGGFVGGSGDEAATATTAVETTSVPPEPETEPTAAAPTTATTEAPGSPPAAFDVPPGLTREEAAVYRLYLLIFGRQPDSSGLEYWSGELANGTPLREMALQLMSTDEFVAEYGPRPTQAELVDLAHQRVYGRPATQEEIEFWEGVGVEGIEFLIAFSNSPEARGAFGTD